MKTKLIQTALCAVLLSLAAGVSAQSLGHSFPLVQVGSTNTRSATLATKSTRIIVPHCFATYVADAQGTSGRTAILAYPNFCGSLSYYGDFGRQIGSMQAGGVTFLHLQVNDPNVFAGNTSSAQLGESVYAPDNRSIEFTFGTTNVTASPNGTAYLSGMVAGSATARQSVQSCTESGCIASSIGLGSDFITVDKEWGAFPGTAVVNLSNELIGIVFGSDSGRTLVMSIARIISLAYSTPPTPSVR